MPVALLTGRVYQDGLGGLRAVLFFWGERSFGTRREALSPIRAASLSGRAASKRSLQVRAHNIDKFVGGESLLGTDLLLWVDDVKPDVALEQFRHQPVHGAARGRD